MNILDWIGAIIGLFILLMFADNMWGNWIRYKIWKDKNKKE